MAYVDTLWIYNTYFNLISFSFIRPWQRVMRTHFRNSFNYDVLSQTYTLIERRVTSVTKQSLLEETLRQVDHISFIIGLVSSSFLLNFNPHQTVIHNTDSPDMRVSNRRQ